MLKNRLALLFAAFISPVLYAEINTTPSENSEQIFQVIDSSYTVCQTQALYTQLLQWSLYGVGTPPHTGCFPAPANAKAIIKQCPESDIIICQFELTPEDGSPVLNVWASKVMLKPVTP